MKFSTLNKTIFIIFFLILFLGSFATFKTYNILPVNLIIDILMVLLLVFSFRENLTINTNYLLIFIILSFLILSYIFNVYYVGVNIKDYFIANKSLYYLAFIAIFINKKIFNVEFIYSFYKVILYVFLIKYILWLILGPFNRPGVFFENNFELPLLLLLYLTLIKFNIKVSLKYNIILFVVFFLSGSLSGFLALSVMYFILSFSKFDKYFLFKLLIAFVVLILLLLVIDSRVTNLEHLDRFIFLQELIYNLKYSSIEQIIFGNFGLRPLRQDTCNMLSFYSSLFSQNNDGKCYSVILHSYILRILYDHGFLGLLLIFSLLYMILLKSNLKNNIIFSILLIVLVNSLSVSGLSNTFIALGIVILITSYKTRTSNV
ncbi:hypothetical protein ACSWVZ_003844 [Photobacterium damselae]